MKPRRPNIVLICTDNQSPWTLGCYGNAEIRTPHIDRLAAGGVRFDGARCVNPVCSPNRATLLTGLIPSQHGVHNWLGGEQPSSQMGPGAYCTIAEFASLPQMLADEGYRCGMSGKLHLGDSAHPQLGFDYWYAKTHGHTSHFYDNDMVWQGEVVRETGYITDRIADHAVDFLDQAGGGERPFFLYVGFNGPYGLDQDLRGGHRNRHTDYYADKPMTCFPREPVHPWSTMQNDLIGSDVAMRGYAAAVSGVDDGVGRVMDKLDELGVAENTLVIYTADHGLCAGHHGMWGMGDHSRPMHMYEENLQVPLIARHPERIPAGVSCETMTCNYDVFPTMLDYLALATRVPADIDLPGQTLVPALFGEPLDRAKEVCFHEYEGNRTIRTAAWKLTLRHPAGPDELYDMAADPGERTNLADSDEYQTVRAQLTERLDAFFDEYADPQYDLWKGGATKAGRMIPQ